MGSGFARNRVLVVLAFVVSAALFAGAAVAFVMARDDNDAKKTVGALPSSRPTLVFPTDQPTATPSATASPTPSAPAPTVRVTSTPSPVATVSPAATSSPAPRRTSTPRPSPTKTVTVISGLSASAALTVVDADNGQYVVKAHATDGSGTIYLKSIDWGDQSPIALNQRGTACSATPPADCRDYSVAHTYADPTKDRIITVQVVSGTESSILHLTIDVS